MATSMDSGQRPLYSKYETSNTNANPYGSGDPYYNASTGYLPPQKPKKGVSKWIKFGVPALILVIVAVVVGAVVGTRNNNNSKNGGSGNSNGDPAAAESSLVDQKNLGRFPTATDSEYFVPLYPSTTNTAAFTTPTFVDSNDVNLAWPDDPFKPANPAPTTVRPDRPRLIAPLYKWQALPGLIANDPYLSGWNASIFNNATQYFSLPPVVYHMDGSSGILDNAREIKMRVKAFAYAFRMTNDTRWQDRLWTELQNAAGNGTTPFGPDTDKWNSGHFLDVAEFTAAFATAYDWLHDTWSEDERSQLRSTMITFGLNFGVEQYTTGAGWWTDGIDGNWNCVCNGGLTMGALAILGDDTSGIAEQILGLTIPNAGQNCAFIATTDGTATETPNYWYFATTGHAEMASALLTATGSSYGLLTANPDIAKTGQYHMYVTGATSLFDYGDHGPNKFSTTANSMLFYADQFRNPQYSLFQRDRFDAPEPWSMFWYDPTVSGAFWDGLPFDAFFDNTSDQWVSMRSSWTDEHALYVAMKAGRNQGHQTHNDLDCGDFVIDALGTRWAGELGSGDYLSEGYFSSEEQGSERWLYYRKRTEGQNTILVNRQNQNVLALPTLRHESKNAAQGSSTVADIPDDDAVYWVADLVSAYNDTPSFSRGVRLLNKRRQVLIQDDITTTQPLQWRMHTNATVETNGASATLTIDGQTLTMQILDPPSGAAFGVADAVRFDDDPALPAGQTDQANPGVHVVTIDLPAGTYSLQVLFNPQWPGMSASDFKTPGAVSLDNWSLDSHN